MNVVKFYTKENCLLCEEAEVLLEALQLMYGFYVEKIDIYEDEELLELYQMEIPVININGEEINSNNMTFERIENVLHEKGFA